MELVQNDDASIEGTNFAFKYSLTAGQTYYIKISAYGTKTGSYALIVSKDLYSASLTGTNQDARKVGMKAEAASVLTTLQVKIGSKSYTLTKPTSGNLDTTVNGARFKVTFTSTNNGLSTIWSITAKLPATTTGTTETVSFIFSKGKVTNVKSADINGFMAYRSSIKTGVDARASGNLQKLLTSMNNTGYTLSVHNWDDTPVTVSSTTKAATGMKIVQKDSSGRITEVYYVVLFGDVAGTGVVGDGLINATDSMNVLKQLKDSMTLGAISQLAADANHDGSITTADSDLILNHAVGKATINQNYTITTVPDECYFQNPVVF